LLCKVLKANENRIQEYEQVFRADFKEGGSKAPDYAKFYCEGFIPFLQKEYKISTTKKDGLYTGIAHWGADRAMDIVLNHLNKLEKLVFLVFFLVGRNKSLYKKDDKADRRSRD